MKKIFFSLAVACVAIVAGNQTFAQAKKTRIGITAGVNYTTMGAATSNGVSLNYDYRVGFQGGVYVDHALAENITFTPGVIFSQKGGDINTTISGITFKGTTQINYLDVPLLFDFKVNSGLSFFAGPQVSLLLSQSSNLTGTMSGSSSSANSTSTDGFRKTLFGGNLGAGYRFTDNVNAKLHYMFDFQHLGDGSNGSTDTGERNSGFALTLGYSF